MEERKEALQHRIVWTDRKRGNITGVTDVGSFDETTVILETDSHLKGKGAAHRETFSGAGRGGAGWRH